MQIHMATCKAGGWGGGQCWASERAAAWWPREEAPAWRELWGSLVAAYYGA